MQCDEILSRAAGLDGSADAEVARHLGACAACRDAIDTATNGGFEWDLAIVQIDQDFKELPGRDNQ